MAGAVTVLMRDTLHPNLMQTLEGQAAFVHAGPFANIAHGNSSILADRVALHLGDYVITESGFGSDMGMEKFMNIKCRVSGLVPDAVVLVATIRALKTHGGGPKVVPGRPLDEAYTGENLPLLEAGLINLVAHIEGVRRFGMQPVVVVNAFPTDTKAEIEAVRRAAAEAGASHVATSTHWADGGAGAVELARAVIEACEEPNDFRLLYPVEQSVKAKIETIASELYGADGVDYSIQAERDIAGYEQDGFGHLPVCMAKTPLSLSHDPQLKGRPTGFRIPVREVRSSVGAGFLVPILGSINTMPGLGSRPAFMNVDIDEQGKIVGLF